VDVVRLSEGSGIMLNILYSPHMTSVDNEAGRASGHADVPLSKLGRQQAQGLGHHYASQAIVAVYCSDLQRARTTAELAFAGREVPIMSDARLRECDYGDLTQMARAQVETEFARRIAEPFPHGESMLMVVRRVGAFLCDCVVQHNRQTVVVIGHRATRYGLEYWCSEAPLAAIVSAEWVWREVPIWRYKLHVRMLARRAVAPGG
jgi:broad specificity phosphatase PhoE